MSEWTEKPFIDYLNAVDEALESRFGKVTDHRDIDQVAAAQEAGDTPEVCAAEMNRLFTIRALNDALRERIGIPIFRATRDRFCVTGGIAELSPVEQLEVIRLVRTHEDFTDDNDPHREHDFGAFDHAGHTIFWKIDYYDHDLARGSEDPADPAKTTRVLTILLAEEW